MLGFYSNDTFIYQSGFTLLNQESIMAQLGIDLYRILIGIAGSVWTLVLPKTMAKKRITVAVFTELGKHSLGIYIVNSYINIYVLKVICRGFEPSFGANIIQTVLITGACWGSSVLISKRRILSRLLLGGR